MKALVIKIKSKIQNGYLAAEGWTSTPFWDDACIFQVEDIAEAKRVTKRYSDGFDSDCNLKTFVVEWTIKEKVIKE